MISTEPITDTQKFKTYNAFRLLNAVFRELALHSSKVKVQDQLYAVYLCCCAHNLRTEEHIKFNFVEMLHDRGMCNRKLRSQKGCIMFMQTLYHRPDLQRKAMSVTLDRSCTPIFKLSRKYVRVFLRRK